MSEKITLITGITEQDGACLAGFLVEKAYRVRGVKRPPSSFNTGHVQILDQDPHAENQYFPLYYRNMMDSTNRVWVQRFVRENCEMLVSDRAAGGLMDQWQTRTGADQPRGPGVHSRGARSKRERRFEVVCLGTEATPREFQGVGSCVDGPVYLKRIYPKDDHIGVESGNDLPIRELVAPMGEIYHDKRLIVQNNKPGGSPRKLVGAARANVLGWKTRTPQREVLYTTYERYLGR